MFAKEEVANYILTIPEEGAASSETFRTDRLSSNKSVTFQTPIQRKKILLFGECKKHTTITKSNKSKTMEVNRDILGKLLSISIRKGRIVDFEKASEYSLSTVPLNISNANGTMRKTNISE